MEHVTHCLDAPETGVELCESDMAAIVAAGGGRYVGLLKEIPGKMEIVVLFASPQTKTTLGLPLSRLTVAAVREHIAESDKLFTKAAASCSSLRHSHNCCNLARKSA